MDYRGIITAGYHVDAGGQTAIRVVSQGYIGVLAAVDFVASPRKVVFALESRKVIFQSEKRSVIATSDDRTIKATA